MSVFRRLPSYLLREASKRSLISLPEVNVLNNAGGRIDDDAIRSIIVLDSIATVGTVIIVHHSGENRCQTMRACSADD